jgi:hypothetical protein
MATDSANPSAKDVLVVGSFPPVWGAGSAATLAAVRRAWASGERVVTAALRPAGADLVAPVAGLAAGLRLERARVRAGRPARLVLGLEPGMLGPGLVGAEDRSSPAPQPRSPAGKPDFVVSPAAGTVRRAAGLVRAAGSVAGLVRALDRFDRVTVLLSEPLDLPPRLRAVLWRHVDEAVLQARDQTLAAAAGLPSALVTVVDDYPMRPAYPGVSILGPAEVLPGRRPLVLAGRLGRRLLGEQFDPLRAEVIRLASHARRRVAAPGDERRSDGSRSA